jgi:integrase
MYYAGLRVEEACQLRWESDRGDELIVVGKGGRTRYQPIVPELREALDALPRVGPWLFMGRGGRGPICTETARQWVRLAGAAAGLGRIVPHQLRHDDLRHDAGSARHRGLVGPLPQLAVHHDGVHTDAT